MMIANQNRASTQVTFNYAAVSMLGLLIFMVTHTAQAEITTLESSPVIYASMSTLDSTFAQSRKRTNPLRHQLTSGLKVKGIKLASNLFLTKLKSMCGHKRLALSLNYSDVLYQLGMDRVSMTVRF